MKFITNKKFLTTVFILFSITGAICLTVRILFSLPFFYEQPLNKKIVTFVLIALVLLVLVIIANKFLILPYISSYSKRKNVLFIILIFVIITATSYISANHYWSVPEKHTVEICFDAADGVQSLDILKLEEPKTYRLYSPKSFGFDYYPIVVESGECIVGEMITLYWNFPLRFLLRNINVVVEEDPPDGRLFISVNDVPAVVYFDQTADPPVGNEVRFTDGFDQGKVLSFARNKYIYTGGKSLCLLFSAFYLALFFFGLTEKITSHTDQHKSIEAEIPLLERKLISPPGFHKILLVFTLIYFIFFGVFMAYTAGQPDQTPHRYYSLRYSGTWGIPEEDPNSALLVTGQPYLYYWMNGAIAKIYVRIFPENQPIRVAILWRLFSVVLSTFTVFYCYKLAAKVTNNPYAGVLGAFFLANTLMFVFVSGGISYDNLMNLAAMAAIYHLVSIYKKENFVRHTALTGTWVIVGSLTKEQFLLLTLIIFLAWLFFVIINLKSIKLTFTKGNIAIGLVFLVFLGLFISLYGVNLIRYARPTPYCSQIKPSETCTGFDSRMEYYEPYSLGALWFYRDHFPNPIEYASQFWVFKMVQSIWGILSHYTFVPRLSVGLHFVLALWALVCLIRYWKLTDKLPLLLLFIIVGYGGYIFYMNFKNEVNFSFQHYGISGRYFSPVYGVIFTLMIYYFLKIRSKFLNKLTLAISVILYFTGGLWMYFSRYAEIFFHWRIFG